MRPQLTLPNLGNECHQITNDRDIAYAGAKPWHGLGTAMQPGQSMDEWLRAAGLAFRIEEANVQFDSQPAPELPGELKTLDWSKVLYRSDTREPLSVVGGGYNPVQPRNCMDFFSEVCEAGAMTMETAGSLRGGAVVWALAKTGEEFALPGEDWVRNYVMFSTSCDLSSSTQIGDTKVRVVCANTYRSALRSGFQVSWSHRTKFDLKAAKRRLANVNASFAAFYETALLMTRRTLDAKMAENLTARIIAKRDDILNEPETMALVKEMTGFKRVLDLFNGSGKGAALESSEGTAWGLFNAVTEYVDHSRRARNEESRQYSAWFGDGARLKQRAMEVLSQL